MITLQNFQITSLGTTPPPHTRKSGKAILGATLGIPSHSRSNSLNCTHDLSHTKTQCSEQFSERLWEFIDSQKISPSFVKFPTGYRGGQQEGPTNVITDFEKVTRQVIPNSLKFKGLGRGVRRAPSFSPRRFALVWKGGRAAILVVVLATSL